MICIKKYDTQQLEDICHAIQQLLQEHNLENQQFISCCIAIAGPINHYYNPDYDTCVITNKQNQNIESTKDIEKLLKCKTTFINDFEAIGYYILSDYQDKKIVDLIQQQKIDQERPICIIGAGTGLGFGFIVNKQVISSEGGHTTFSPQNSFDMALLNKCQDIHSYHVSWERILSGQGIETLYQLLLTINEEQTQQCRVKIDYQKLCQSRQQYLNKQFTAREISSFAQQENIYLFELTMKIWFFYYGRAIYDHIVVFLPNEVYIGGGIMYKNITLIQKSHYLDEFKKGISENGRSSKLTKTVTIRVLTDDDIGLYGSLFKAIKY